MTLKDLKIFQAWSWTLASREGIISSINDARKIGSPIFFERMKLDPDTVHKNQYKMD